MISQRASEESLQISTKMFGCDRNVILKKIFSWCIVVVSLGVSQAAGNADGEGAGHAEVAAKAWVRCKLVTMSGSTNFLRNASRTFAVTLFNSRRNLGSKLLETLRLRWTNSTVLNYVFLFGLNHDPSRDMKKRNSPYLGN